MVINIELISLPFQHIHFTNKTDLFLIASISLHSQKKISLLTFLLII